MKCPDCGCTVDIDFTPEFSEALPYELVCYGCGWFDPQRYATEDDAASAEPV